MSSLKDILFTQYASEGLTALVDELQHKYKPKKGRRFHHNNITYEISRPHVKDNKIEFEISSKIPQDELSTSKDMQIFFKEIKKILNKEKNKPISIEMENIVWDSKKDTEKERDYVKLLYQYPLDDLYDNQEIINQFEKINKGEKKVTLPEVPSVFTTQGKLVLLMVRETIQKVARDNMQSLIEANKQVKTTLTR